MSSSPSCVYPFRLRRNEHVRGNLVGIGAHAPFGKGDGIDRVEPAARVNLEAQALFAGIRIGAQQRLPAKAPGPHGRSLDNRDTVRQAIGSRGLVGARSRSGG